jgi:iron complex transport system permease protein
LLLAAAALGIVVLFSLAIGSRSIPVGTVVQSFTSFDPTVQDQVIVRSLRLPRTLLGLAVGIALGLSGAGLQGLTRNPLADPSIFGINAGAAFAVVLGITVVGISTLLGYIWFAFLGAAVATTVVYVIGSQGREGTTPVKLALAGAALSAVLGSFTTLLLLRDAEGLGAYVRFWIVGTLAGRDETIILQTLPFIAVGAAMALVSGRLLNALSLGDEVARSLGQRVGRARAWCAASVVVLAGAATAAAGPITFVGLTIPHAARAITGPDYRWILPYSAVLGAILLLAADIVGRVVVSPNELRVGVVTALLGAPFFVALVRRRRMREL